MHSIQYQQLVRFHLVVMLQKRYQLYHYRQGNFRQHLDDFFLVRFRVVCLLFPEINNNHRYYLFQANVSKVRNRLYSNPERSPV